MENTRYSLSSKEKLSIMLLTALAVICIVYVLSPLSFANVLLFFLSFPYAQIGFGLRTLSLAGGVWNVIAFVIYFCICSVPVFVFASNKEKRREDALLTPIGFILLGAIFYMINPSRLHIPFVHEEMQNAVIGSTIHSVVLAYATLRLLRRLSQSETIKISQWMYVGLHFLNALFVVMVFGYGFEQIVTAFDILKLNNIGNEHLLGTTYFFVVLRHIVWLLPYSINIVVCFFAIRLVGTFRKDPYSEDTTSTADTIVRVCKIALGVTVLSSTFFHVFQIMFISRLYDISSNLNLPLSAMLFTLGALLLSRYIASSKQIKDENEGFV